jgi:hypothetical protein
MKHDSESTGVVAPLAEDPVMSNVEGPCLTLNEMRAFREASGQNPDTPMRAGEVGILFIRILRYLRHYLEPGVPKADSIIRACNDMRGIVERGVVVTFDMGGEVPDRIRFHLHRDDHAIGNQNGHRFVLLVTNDAGNSRDNLDPADGLRIAQAVNALLGFG